LDSVLSDKWAHAVSYLVLYFNETPLSNASCFFWKFEGKTYLITNWHNFSGRNSDTMELLSNTGAIPNRAKFTYFTKIEDLPESDLYQMQMDCLRKSGPIFELDSASILELEYGQESQA